MKARILISRFRVFWLAGVCLALLLLDAFLAMTLIKAKNENSVSATLVPYVHANDDIAFPRPLVREAMTQEELDFLTRSLIKEYIVARFAVSGSGLDANECIFYENPTADDCPVLAIPSIDWKGGRGGWTAAFSNLIDGSDGDKDEIFRLRSVGSTRSARFLSEPKRYRDRWVVGVEFITRERGVWSMGEARREQFEIHLDADEIFNFHGAEFAINYAPSSYFAWQVNWVRRFPLRK